MHLIPVVVPSGVAFEEENGAEASTRVEDVRPDCQKVTIVGYCPAEEVSTIWVWSAVDVLAGEVSRIEVSGRWLKVEISGRRLVEELTRSFSS